MENNKQHITINREFYVAKDTKVIFVSDFFCQDYVGGAELTLEALYEVSPYKTQKIHSASLTEEMIRENKDKTWILVNFTGALKSILSFFVKYNCKYFVIECDYKFCQHRSEHHHLQITGKSCDCHLNVAQGKWIEAFYKRASNVFFMSEAQMNRYAELFPSLSECISSRKFVVQSSTFSKNDLESIVSLTYRSDLVPIDKWAVLNGPSWIKNQEGTEAYCKTYKIEYEVMQRLPYKEFLEQLSRYRGLVFHPSGYDTCPRLVIEAKLLGLELDLNDNVQIKNEPWFKNSTQDDLYKFLINKPAQFWDFLKEKI